MDSVPASSGPVLEAAADWVLKLQDPAITPEEIGRWTAWCAEDPEHLHAFRSVQSLWQRSADIREMPVGPHELAADRYSGEVPVSQWRTAPPRAAPRWPYALAASLLVAAGVAAYLTARDDLDVTAATGVNQQLQLEDRSNVVLAAGSTLRATFRSDAREVYLDRGEAFFEVQKDPARPFTVHTFGRSITAIGTAFNVRAEEGAFQVTVTEGTVDVARADGKGSRRRLSAGEQISVIPGEASPRLARVDARRATGWRSGSLQFVDEPLSSVVSAVSRYSRTPVSLRSAELGSLRFTGTVRADRIDEWLQGLPNIFPVVVKRPDAGGEIQTQPAPR